MSLFDDVLGDDNMFEEAPFGPQEGYAGVLLCASACDGHIADEIFDLSFLPPPRWWFLALRLR